LSACSLPGDQSAKRIIRVRILADSNIREHVPRWREDIGGKFKAAADFFENEFGVDFPPPVIQPWNPQGKATSTTELMSFLKRDADVRDKQGSFDITIGFTWIPGRISRGHARVDEIGNCRDGLGKFIAIASTGALTPDEKDAPLGNIDASTLVHELGHIFGAEHSEDPNSLMAVNFRPYADFDQKSRAIILKNILCPFAK
jgi:matrixin